MTTLQSQHLLQLSTPLPLDELLLIDFSGVEYLSKPFRYTLRMISTTMDIDPAQLLNQPISVQIYTSESQPPRFFHGLVSYFEGGEVVDRIRYYRAELRPWLWFMNYNVNCRIFQQKNVIDMVKIICNDYANAFIDLSMLHKSNYPERRYCLQYRESNLNFMQRLLEEEGIFYFFHHEQEKHTWILADGNQAFSELSPNPVSFNVNVTRDFGIHKWSRAHHFYAGKMTQSDYYYEKSTTPLDSQQSGTATLPCAQPYEMFTFPGRHNEIAIGNQRAQHRLEAQEIAYRLWRGQGNHPQFVAGAQFQLINPPVASEAGNYFLTEVLHHATDGTYLQGSEGGQSYYNVFMAVPMAMSYRPIAQARKPFLPGIQTATVVGDAGQELNTDTYGQIKVQFHWDRYGKSDDNSSCYIRVAQLWAGDGWGMQFLPRVGQEVVVHFIEGDPDRPLIMGTVYNQNHANPYELPFSQTQSGIKTRSSPGGCAQDFNELRFEDKKNAEEIFIHAQKDLKQIIKNDFMTTINHDAVKTIDHDYKITVGNDFQQDVNNNWQLHIGKTATIEAAQSLTLKVGQTTMQLTSSGIAIQTEKMSVDKN